MLSLYVNDLVIFIVHDEQDLRAVKVILVVFVCALGLHTNTGATARSRRPPSPPCHLLYALPPRLRGWRANLGIGSWITKSLKTGLPRF
jgi:hypothetical protein